jgi:hypothetical protein
MDKLIARIKEYVQVIDEDLDDDDFLDFTVAEVVDRALVYTNRDQLVTQYGKDLVLYPLGTEDFWEDYEYPIPARLERTLANTVVGVHKTVKERNTATTGQVASISDNGQSISYRQKVASFLDSSDDSEVFSGATRLLGRYMLPVIPTNGDTNIIQKPY